MACAGCGEPICSDHAGLLRRQFWCEGCFTRQRTKGTILAWGFAAAMVIAAIVIFLLM